MIRVLGARVLVALPPSEPDVVTPSGIILTRDPDRLRTPTKGIVLQLGTKRGTVDLADVLAIHDEVRSRPPAEVRREFCRLLPAPFEVQVGDCVLFLPSSGELIVEGDIEYAVLHESEIIGVLEPKEHAA